MDRTIAIVISILMLAGYLYYDYSHNRLSKEHLVNKASYIGLADITSVKCPTDSSCKGYYMTMNPVNSVKGDLPMGASIFMKKG